MKGETNWKLKLKALLHDPPNKMWVMFEEYKKHEEIAEKFFRCFFEESVQEEKVNIADRISSALSRVIVAPNFEKEEEKEEFENKTLISWEELKFIDIFSGRRQTSQLCDSTKEIEKIFKKIENIVDKLSLSEEERSKFLFLFFWRFYPEIFPWINTHPADSRAPNHSIYDHLVQTSAIVSALPNPAFFLFTIAPVQSFIATARKTQDLWAGSYLLSYLVWESMIPIINNLGPDNIIFPNLFRQSLIDFYLKKLYFGGKSFKELTEGIIDNGVIFFDIPEKLSIANFPNRFLAIVPFDKKLAKSCEEEFKKTLKNLADETADKLAKKLSINETKNIKNSLKTQIESHLLSYFQVYWVMLPWCKEGKIQDLETVFNEYKTLVGETELYQIIKLISEHTYYKPVNVGIVYSLLLELNERLLSARKGIRNTFITSAYTQEGEKCTLCGEFNELWLLDCEPNWKDSRLKEENRKKWKILEKDYTVRPNERLCGVCILKRLFPEILKNKLNLKEEFVFPSVVEISATGFKRTLTEQEKKKIKETFEKFLKQIEKKGNKKLPPGNPVPQLKNDILSQIDAMFLMETTYRKEFLEEEYGIKNLDEKDFEDILKILKELREKKGKIPSVYYAILQMDGDNMGKWLRGEFLPKIEEVILPKVKDALFSFSKGKECKKLEKILCSSHHITPSIHQAFSRKLSDFALNSVKEIVEDQHYGKLIYAGGDDILAFLPIEEVLDCAYRLQEVFKNSLSGKASMSAGIVIAHCKYPLYLALEEVRNMEKKAKNEFEKDAFCIEVITHSGEIRYSGGKWELVSLFKDLICKFKTEEISSTFPYQFLETVEKLMGKEDKRIDKTESVFEIIKGELKRIYERKVEDKEFLEKLIKIYENYPFGYQKFANIFIIAKFLEKERKF